MSERILYSLLIAAVGGTVGYLAQRSRMCFVAGLRDFILVRDRELLSGLFSFLLTVWVLSSAFYGLGLLEQRMPEYGDIQVVRTATVGRATGAEGTEDAGRTPAAPAASGTPDSVEAGGAREAAAGPGAPAGLDASVAARGFPRIRFGTLVGSPAGGFHALFGRFFWTSLGGGALIGFLSVLAGGCVLRQHVLCAQGNRNALFFVLGFYAAAVVFGLLFFDRLSWFYG